MAGCIGGGIMNGKDEKGLTNELLAFEENHAWVNENLKTLLKDYSDQWIGVKNSEVIASDPDLEILLSKLPDPANTCIEFITLEPLEIVMKTM
jgi:hypothetical protein